MGATTSKPKRQAVVVVHGQGEQRPMGTLRDFIQVLWTRNPNITPKNPDKYIDEDGNRSFWVVPDRKTGLYELQRLTTPEAEDGRRTDFFELYYADLLNDTPFKNLWRWIRRLLWIDPADVPGHLRWPWMIFWLFTLVAMAQFFYVVLSVREIIHTDWVGELLRPDALPYFWAILGLSGLIVLPKLVLNLRFLARIPMWVHGMGIAILVAIIFRGHPVALSVDLLAVEGYLAATYLLPYFGDAASYLSAQTETVKSRQDVRERGLSLLRALHNDDNYERVVVVGHSLGTVLAYDLLHILWGEVGPTKDNPPQQAALDAIGELDAFVASRGDNEWSGGDVARYQDLQWAAFKALREEGHEAPDDPSLIRNGWKVSDFVALGSPLASAQFLVTEGPEDFALMKQERVLPTAPAQPYSSEQQSLYSNEEAGAVVSHHAAVFSVVRWTNIYDAFHPLLFVLGDPIAGPVGGPERFGPAVKDVNVTITRQGPFSRLFTHSWYWTETSRNEYQPASHIVELRRAIGLSRT